MTKFGVQLPNFSGFDPADLFEHVAGLATATEESGFDSVWVMDHFFQLPPRAGGRLSGRPGAPGHAGGGRSGLPGHVHRR